MHKACKPVHLWLKSGRKHIAYLIKERKDAWPSSLDVGKRSDMQRLFLIALGCVLGTSYTFGLFSPPRDLTNVKRPPGTCDPPPKRKCPRSPPPQPCPPEKGSPPSKPCN